LQLINLSMRKNLKELGKVRKSKGKDEKNKSIVIINRKETQKQLLHTRKKSKNGTRNRQ